MRAAEALVVAALVTGCAPAFSTLAGGRTVPSSRTDLLVGTAVRIPTGDLLARPPIAENSPGHGMALAAPGGVAPVGSVRHGLGPNADLGAEVSGSTARFALRGQWWLGPYIHFMTGVAPYVGYLRAEPSTARALDAFRGGLSVPLLLTVDVFSAYEAWIGARLGVEHVNGSDAALTGVRTGGVIGLGVGFRRFWVLVELSVDYEWWTGSVGSQSIDLIHGLALTPAVGLRLRL